MTRRKRILFFAEAVTLAHVARPIALASALKPQEYECAIACDPRYARFLETGHWRNIAIHTISSQKFLNALATGRPHHDYPVLKAYMAEDLRVIADYQPDLIVGDFRLSLAVSARVTGVPYAAISNAYWSPFYAGPALPVPVLPLTRWLPIPLAQALFSTFGPLAMNGHCAGINRLRRENGLESVGNHLARAYTDADYNLYPDLPELFPMRPLPPTHSFIGSVLWSPHDAVPPWWDELRPDPPVVYLTLGSSGQASLLQMALDALADLPVQIIASTAGGPMPARIPANARVTDYLPGTEAAARSALMICNAGSLSCQQALASGVPVLGIAINIDQFLNMAALTAAGAGLMLRADRVNPAKIASACLQILRDERFRQAAHKLREALHHAGPAGARFEAMLPGLLQAQPSPAA